MARFLILDLQNAIASAPGCAAVHRAEAARVCAYPWGVGPKEMTTVTMYVKSHLLREIQHWSESRHSAGAAGPVDIFMTLTGVDQGACPQPSMPAAVT